MEEKRRINFFKRLKIAIFNLDEYGIFIDEKLGVSIKYMILILIFSSIILSLVTTTQLSKEIKKGLNYFENEFPDFHFEDENLKIDRYVEGYDKEYDVKLIADTNDISQNKIEEYIKQTNDASTALIVLSDKIIYRNYDVQNEFTYDYINTAIELKDSTKSDLLEEYKTLGGEKSIITTGMIIMTLALFIENLIELVTYTLLVSIVAIIVGRICGIAMKYQVAVTLSIYSLTVPVLCSLVYGIVYSLTGFEIKYFSAMYLMIAYVYIIAAILIIKTDLMKQSKDLMRIKSVEEQIQDEIEKRKLEEEQENTKKEDEKDEEKEGKPKDDNKKDEPEPNLDKPDTEPDGSEI